MASCRFTLGFHKEVRSLWITPYRSKTCLRTHEHKRLLSERLDRIPPARRRRRRRRRRTDAKQGLFEMLIVGRKGRDGAYLPRGLVCPSKLSAPVEAQSALGDDEEQRRQEPPTERFVYTLLSLLSQFEEHPFWIYPDRFSCVF